MSHSFNCLYLQLLFPRHILAPSTTFTISSMSEMLLILDGTPASTGQSTGTGESMCVDHMPLEIVNNQGEEGDYSRRIL